MAISETKLVSQSINQCRYLQYCLFAGVLRDDCYRYACTFL